MISDEPNIAARSSASRLCDNAPSFVGSGEIIDHENEPVRAFVAKTLQGKPDDSKSQAVALYYAVRDGIFYEIFDSNLGQNLSASTSIREGRGFCLHKAVIYAAACRAVEIPCRLVAATVRNHISSPSISALVGGDIFLHWYNEVLLDGHWLKVAPIFNALTCRVYGIQPLEFTGDESAVAQPYHGGNTMMFLSTPVQFDNPTRAEILGLVQAHHPKMFGAGGRVPREIDVRRELHCAASMLSGESKIVRST